MARDKIHDAVKNALIKDGWIILADPFHIVYEEFSLLIDLAAERPIAAEREGQKIVVEIKTFGGLSFLKELQQALGQYEIYHDVLELTKLDYTLYLGISESVYFDGFGLRATKTILQRHGVNLLVVDAQKEEIVTWIR